MECSWNDGSKTQYYIVILDRLQGCSGELERAPESQIRGPLTDVQICGKLVPFWGSHNTKADSTLEVESSSGVVT